MLVIYACSRRQYKELEQEYEMLGVDPDPLFPYRGIRLDLLVTLGGIKKLKVFTPLENHHKDEDYI
jgi:hypothetical protein